MEENHLLTYSFVFVYFAICNEILIFLRSSRIITISLASIAASEPICPIETPISAVFKTGASFTPSPTNNVLPFFFNSFTFSTLSCGSNEL